ncbi:MAG: DUF2207 domain-containing protein [Saprospirales bacterium]|nr:DUF2207 domain-containing protein [Saprospirales bacterium]MBK8489506.1 DUF2207 domain-containing protein [Saprospirales bacterium]
MIKIIIKPRRPEVAVVLNQLVLVLGMLLLALPVQAEYFTIENYQVHITVEPSGDFLVEETIDVLFDSERHGIFRSIPYKYKVGGKTQKVKLRNVKVDGWPAEKSWDLSSGYLTLKIGHADSYVNGRQRYVIRYKVKNAWLFLQEHTEFYWNVVGTEWENSIKKVEYQIDFFDAPSLSTEDYHVYTGSFGKQDEEATIYYRGGSVAGQSLVELGPGEGLTVAVRLPVDYIHRPTPMELFIQHYGLLALPLALMIGLFWLWARFGKDEKRVLVVQYYPPENFPPSEAGAFIDHKVDHRDLIALIPYWGAQGFLELTEKENKGLLFKSKDYEFTRLKMLPGDRPDYERTVFNGLFGTVNQVMLSDLKDSFYSTMTSAKSQLTRLIHSRMLYTPRSRQLFNILPIAGILAAVVAVLFIIIDQVPAGIGMGVVAISSFIFLYPMLRRSTEGTDIYEHLRGFREFIKRADQQRLERLLQDDPAYFDKTLPYAIAFNMAKNWSSKFDGLFTEPPSWYHGYYVGHSYGSNFGSFAQDFTSSMHEVQSAFTSRPGSSGSGSFGGGGGGFSGGGFGGGGGGSW